MSSGGLPEIPITGGAEPPCLTEGCSACCHDTEMLLTNEDVLRLSLSHPEGDWWAEEDGYLVLQNRDGPSAPGGTGRPCTFLGSDGRCTVHDERPAGCRLYPAMWDVDAGRATLDQQNCPHPHGFVLDRFTAGAVERLASTLEAERDARIATRA